MQQLQTYRSRPDGECGSRNLTSGKHTPNEQGSNVTFSASRIVHTISHKTGKRMCGSSSRTFSLLHFPTRVAYHLPHNRREFAVLRAAHSLFFSNNAGGRMCGSWSHAFSLPLAYHFPQHRREMRGSSSRTFLSACPILLRMRQHREREILRTLRSLPLAYPLSHHRREKCAVLRAAHSLPLAYLLPQNRREKCAVLRAVHFSLPVPYCYV